MTRAAGRRRLVVLSAATLILCSCDRPMRTTPAPDSKSAGNAARARFLALGDSYTIGEAVEEAERWPNQLNAEFRRRGREGFGRVQIVATTGWTTEELAAGIDAAAPAGPFDLVSLLIGVNNQYRGRPVEGFRPEFAGLLERAIKFAGGDTGKVIVLSIPDWGVMPFAADRDRGQVAREIDAFNAACRAEAAARGVRFIDVTGISRSAATRPALIASDGLHPSAEQYRLWAEAVADAIAPR